MKKIIALLLAVIMLFTLGTSAFAATITVNNAVSGQTYNAYKIFDVTKTTDTEPVGYAYTIDADSEWFADVANYTGAAETNGVYEGNGLKLVANSNGAYSVSVDEKAFDAVAFAAYLNTKKAGKTVTGTANATGTNDENVSVTITVAEAGYYFVDSSLGALCILNTAADTFAIDEKNEKPTITKTHDKLTASIGETITYTLTINVGAKADTTYIVHDTMETGLTLNKDSFVIKFNGAEVDDANYVIDTEPTDGHTFDITFVEAYTAAFASGDVITITYTAVLNENAEIADETNDNTANLQYGNSYTVDTTVQTKTFEFDLIKTDSSNNIIEGAEFKLYKDAKLTQAISFVKTGNTYRVATADETGVDTIIEVGTASIVGLGNGTYYLVETAAPAGYNLLTAPVEVVINNANNNTTSILENGVYTNNSGGIKVENKTGSVLPSTGGIGTTVFYVVGGVLMVAAVVLLVVKKRMSAED